MNKSNKYIKILLWHKYKNNNVTFQLLKLIIPNHYYNKEFNAVSLPDNAELQDAFNGWYQTNTSIYDIKRSIKELEKANIIIRYKSHNNKLALSIPSANKYIKIIKRHFLMNI